MNRLDPALIHVNDIWWVPHTVRAVASRTSHPVPIVAHVRQEIEPVKVRRYELDRVEAVIAISRQVEQSLIAGGVSAQKVRTVYSGIDLSERQLAHDDQAIRQMIGLPNGAVLLGTVANLFPRKGYEVMLRALPAIVRAVPTVHYVIVGSDDHDYADRLKAARSGAEDCRSRAYCWVSGPGSAVLGCSRSVCAPGTHGGLRDRGGRSDGDGKGRGCDHDRGPSRSRGAGRNWLACSSGRCRIIGRRPWCRSWKIESDESRWAASGKARAHERFSLDASVKQMEQLYGEVLEAQKGRG